MKTELTHALVNVVGCGDPMLGMMCPDSPPENQSATEIEGISEMHGRELDGNSKGSQISLLIVNHKKGKLIMRSAQRMLH